MPIYAITQTLPCPSTYMHALIFHAHKDEHTYVMTYAYNQMLTG